MFMLIAVLLNVRTDWLDSMNPMPPMSAARLKMNVQEVQTVRATSNLRRSPSTNSGREGEVWFAGSMDDVLLGVLVCWNVLKGVDWH